eukprot:5854138-Pyramimonas_sp.AAC.1
MANHRLLFALFERRRCAGHHQHVSVCNEELSTAARYTSKMQSLFADAVQLEHDLFQENRDPFHGRPYFSTVLVTSVRGYDLDDPTIPRQPDGSITRTPSGGLGCLARAKNVNMRSSSLDRNPKTLQVV